MLNKIRNKIAWVIFPAMIVYICFLIYQNRARDNQDVIEYSARELERNNDYLELAEYFKDRSSIVSNLYIETFKDTLRYVNLVSHKAILNREVILEDYSEKYVYSLMKDNSIGYLEINFGNYIIFKIRNIRGNNFGNAYYVYFYSGYEEFIKKYKNYKLAIAPDIPESKNSWIYIIDSTWAIMLSSPQ